MGPVYEEKLGEQLHKAEQLEIDFVKSQGGSPNYNDVENHISDLHDLFDNTDEDEIDDEREDIELMKEDLEDEVNQCVETVDDMHEDLDMKIEAIKSMVEQDGFDADAVMLSIEELAKYIDDRCEDATDHLQGIV